MSLPRAPLSFLSRDLNFRKLEEHSQNSKAKSYLYDLDSTNDSKL
ncbi:hypothetical protein [Bacillus canaveralius]|nr:hypothetical protein [Bacillus canaveralius]